MRTKTASKTLSLFLTFCMVFTMLPTAAFAETGDVDSGVTLGENGPITPVITGITVNPTTLPSTGGEVTVTMTGTNLPTISQAGAFRGNDPTPAYQTDMISDDSTTVKTHTLTIGGNISMTDDRVYTIKMFLNGMFWIDTHTATVTVEKSDKPSAESPQFAHGGNLPDTKEVAVGTKLTLSVVATSPDGGTLSYEWFKKADSEADSVVIPGATAAIYEIPSVSEADVGTYYAEVTNNKEGHLSKTTNSNWCDVTVKPAVSSNTYNVTNQGDWESLISNTVIGTWSGSGHVINLPSDKTLTGSLTIPTAVTGLTINGNGATIEGGIYCRKIGDVYSPTNLVLNSVRVETKNSTAVVFRGGGTLTTSGDVTLICVGNLSVAVADGHGLSSTDDLTVTAGGRLTITGADKHYPNSSGNGMSIGGNLTLDSGSPIIKGGSGSGITIGNSTTPGNLYITGDCSPTISSEHRRNAANVWGDIVISSSGTATFETPGTGGYGIHLLGSGKTIDLSGLTGKLVVDTNKHPTKAIMLNSGSILYPSGLAQNKKYNDTDNFYTLDMTSVTPTPIEITGFEALSNVNAGTAGSAAYENTEEVISALPTSVTANHASGSVSWPVSTWVDTDGYNPAAAGSYTFTATLGTAPTGYTNSGSHTATVEVVVNAPSGGGVTQVANAEQLKTELEKTVAQTIEITGGFTVTEPIFMASNHELRIPSDKTLTFSGEGRIRFGANGTFPAHTLTINGGGNLVLSCTGSFIGISGSEGTLNLSSIHVAVKSYVGIGIKYLNVGNGATISSEGEDAGTIISLSADGICTVNTGGLIDIRDYGNTGIHLNGSMLHINGGTVTFVMNDVGNSGISVRDYGTSYGSLKYSSGTLSGSNGAAISFNQGTKAEGLNGKFSDQNHILSTSGTVTVGDATAAPSTNGLTAGTYYWDGERFAKHMITISSQPQDMSVTGGAISGTLSVSGTASNGKTVTYQWKKADQDSLLGPTYIIPGATSNTFTIPTDLTEGSYYYYCVLRAAECPIMESDIATVTVNAPGDTPTITITKHPQNVTVTQGRINGTLTAEAVANNSKSVRYQWYRFIGGIGGDNVEIITGATSNTFTIPTGLTAGTYQYLCIFNTDGTDYVDSNTAIVTVNPPSSGSGGSSGGSGGGSYTPPPATTPQQAPPNQPVTATTPVTATRGTNGIANANIPTSAISDAITRAQTAARAQGSSANGISVGLNVTMPQGATSLTAVIPQSALQSLITAGVNQLTVNGAPVSLGLNQSALQAIQSQASGGITIGMTPATGLSAPAQSMIGSRPVYNITISYTDKSGKTQNITSFGSGTVTLAIPYTPGRKEAAGYLYGVYVDGKGNASRIPGSGYDANSRSILIPTNHLSVYGVGYTVPSSKFTDVANHWAKDSIDYVVGRGLLSGTSETTFSPNTAMTRGMLVTALGRLAGVDVNAYSTNSFTDLKADSAFRPYVEWAYKKGIVQGIGSGQFAPDRAISREEIAVILQNYAKTTGYKLPVTRGASAFADASSIGSAYKTAVTAMQQAGIMMGEQNNKFNPKANATRAEVSSMLHRYIKLTIDPATAQGWAQGDDGQYMYYKDSKLLTGWQIFDGAKYFFNTDGTLKIGWVKDGDNWRHYTGNKAAIGWLDISNKCYYFTKDGLMVSGKWLQIDAKWYYFNADGSLAKNTKIDGYEVDENGVRKSK